MRVVRVKRFIQEEDTVEWLVEGLLPSVGWTLFYGEQGVGKTTFAMQLCHALQTGEPFLGRKTLQRNVLYIQADSPTLEWREILKRIVPKGNDAFTVVDVHANLFGNEQYIKEIEAFMAFSKPSFVVFDCLYTMKGINDSLNNESILKPIGKMNTLCGGLPWMLIHHPPHGENRAAGNRSISSNCSNEWSLLKTRLSIHKARLLGIKEILLQKDKQGLWSVHQTKMKGDDAYYDREI